ncbi:MAG: rRNA maturation RNase YbeY [Actinomycetota bacterium]
MTPASLDLADVPGELRPAAKAALRAAGVAEGHLSVDLVVADRIRELNREHRGRDEPTDVLSFPIDGAEGVSGPRELGDVVICPEHAVDLNRATVHGVLHLCGYDHETDVGEMLALEATVMQALRPAGDRGARSEERG